MSDEENGSKESGPPLWAFILVGVVVAFFVLGYFFTNHINL